MFSLENVFRFQKKESHFLENHHYSIRIFLSWAPFVCWNFFFTFSDFYLDSEKYFAGNYTLCVCLVVWKIYFSCLFSAKENKIFSKEFFFLKSDDSKKNDFLLFRTGKHFPTHHLFTTFHIEFFSRKKISRFFSEKILRENFLPRNFRIYFEQTNNFVEYIIK